MRVIGVDPGTKSFDVCGLEDGHVVLDESYPSQKVAEAPEEIVADIEAFKPELLVGPSGYGVPLKQAAALTGQDRFEMTLERSEEAGQIPVLAGVQRMIDQMKERGLNVWFMPGVKHLPTVPSHRKINRIDMGTADKVAIALLAVETESRRRGLPYGDTSFVLIELGYGYSAALAVEEGRVVDGVGGTMFPGPGFVNMGSLDGELAYLRGGFGKHFLFGGGAATVAAGEAIPPEDFVRRMKAGEDQARSAMEAFIEAALRAAAMELAIFPAPVVLLSGRLSRVPGIRDTMTDRLEPVLRTEVRTVNRLVSDSESKEAAQGAALLADGLAGGRFAELVNHLQIRESEGGLFDHLYVEGVYRGPDRSSS